MTKTDLLKEVKAIIAQFPGHNRPDRRIQGKNNRILGWAGQKPTQDDLEFGSAQENLEMARS